MKFKKSIMKDFDKVVDPEWGERNRPTEDEKFSWAVISTHPDLPEWFIWKYRKKLDITSVFKNTGMNEEFIERLINDGVIVPWNSIAASQHLSEVFIEKYKDNLEWNDVCNFQNLSENFMRKHQEKLEWYSVCANQKLSEDFIREFKDFVEWIPVSACQVLSEPFISEFEDYVDWEFVSERQILSIPFMDNYWNRLSHDMVSRYQRLTEGFIRRHVEDLDWQFVSMSQKLSEDFIGEFRHKVEWKNICKFQKLSEPFMEEFSQYVIWEEISQYQNLSYEFILKHKDRLPRRNIMKYQGLSLVKAESIYGKLFNEEISALKDNWWTMGVWEKKTAVEATGKYDCHEDYFIAYKTVRPNRCSKFNFQYQYLQGKTYKAWCDASSDENSFGLSCGTFDFCKSYKCRHNEPIIRVKVKYKDVGRIVFDGRKIRCRKIEVLN